jgi:hypothetical protein
VTSPLPKRLKPPDTLSEGARAEFLRIVTAERADHFKPSDLPLLIQYCEARLCSHITALSKSSDLVDDRRRSSANGCKSGRCNAALAARDCADKCTTPANCRGRNIPIVGESLAIRHIALSCGDRLRTRHF